MEKTAPKPKNDPFFRIKYLGYCLARTPELMDYDDFVRFCKFQLAHRTNTLLKDPIWDKYTSEEIIVEFFAHKFESDRDARNDFEIMMEYGKNAVDEFSDWADKQMAKSKKEREEHQIDVLDDSVSFNPAVDVVGDE